jgi:hypothetical protein
MKRNKSDTKLKNKQHATRELIRDSGNLKTFLLSPNNKDKKDFDKNYNSASNIISIMNNISNNENTEGENKLNLHVKSNKLLI